MVVVIPLMLVLISYMIIMLVIAWRTSSLKYLSELGVTGTTGGLDWTGVEWDKLVQSCTGWVDCQELLAQLNKRAGLLM